MSSKPAELRSLAAKSLCIRLVYEWASHKMAVIDSWKNEHGYGTCPEHDWCIWQMNEMQVPESILVPDLVRDQIEFHITSILNRVTDWILYHHRKNFFHDEPAASPLKEYVLKLVWKPNRSIDYTATAKNVLAGSIFNAMEKYRFACTYCLADEVTNLRDTEPARLTKGWDFEAEPFLVYWSKYLADELYTIRKLEIFSIEVVMFAKSCKESGLWSAIEYFFTRMDAADRSRVMNEFVDNQGAQYLEELLAKLDNNEWLSACRDSIACILENCAELGDFKQIRRVWSGYRETVDSKNLARIVQQLVPLSMKNNRNFNALTPILIDIWSSVTAELRQSTVESELLVRVGDECADLIDNDGEFDFKARREYDKPMAFFRMLLFSCDTRRREIFLRDNLHWLVIWAPSTATVKKLLEEFLLTSLDVANLIKDTKDSSEVRFSCLKLLRFGEFDYFNDIVLFFVSGTGELDDITESSILEYKLTLITNVDGFLALSSNLYSGDWRTVSRFVESTFRPISFAPTECMILLIREGFIRSDYLRKKLIRGEMNDIIEFGNAYLAGDPRFAPFKKRCMFELFRCIFVEPDGMIFKREDVQNFFAWCSDDSESVEEWLYIQPGLFPRAFVAQLKSCVDEFTFEASDSMEQFLQWGFPNESEKRQFKRKMIHSYTEYEQISDLLRQRKYRQRALNWFFDNDADFIECFAFFYSSVKVRVAVDRDEDVSRDEGGSSCYRLYLLACIIAGVLRFLLYIANYPQHR